MTPPLTPDTPDPGDRGPDRDVEAPLDAADAWELLGEDGYEAVTEGGRIVAVHETATGEVLELEEPAGIGGPGEDALGA
jgi:hypothetical protein